MVSALAIVVSAIVLFFASFLSWMVLQLHKKDWNKLPNEDEVMAAVKKGDAPTGSYVFRKCPVPSAPRKQVIARAGSVGRATVTG